MKIDFMETRIHCYVMNVRRAALALLLAGTLHAEEGIRILSADLADNVLLEISTDTPRSVMASSDLKTWSYVFHYLPACQNFKAYAAQIRRKQTFYELAPVHPTFAAVDLEPGTPTLEGKAFGNIGWKFSFSAGGIGTYDPNYIGPHRITYSILDSRPGMISVRTIASDGHRRDHLILVVKPGILEFGEVLAYTASRFGDCISGMSCPFSDEFNVKNSVPHRLESEVAAPSLATFTGEGMTFQMGDSADGGMVALGTGGMATITKPGSVETVSYQFFFTGRITVILSRASGKTTTIMFNAGNGDVWHRFPHTEPYSLDGRAGAYVITGPQVSP